MPTVSIIIPCFNTANYLSDAVESALRQTFNDFELIIVDDGSTDNTAEVAGKYSSDIRVCYHYQENSGLSAARNKGISLALGDFIALLDADDIWLPDKLNRQMTLFAARSDVSMVYTDYAIFDSTGIIASSKLPGTEAEIITFLHLFVRNNFIYPSTVVVRKDVLAEYGGFDTALRSIEDYDMWLRIAWRLKIVGIPEVLVQIRQHDSNMSTNVARMLDSELAVLEKHRRDVSAYQFRRRQARVYYLAADRLACQLCRCEAFVMLARGVVCCPQLVGILVVFIKMLLGGDRVMRLRRMIESGDSLLGKLYWMIYRKY